MVEDSPPPFIVIRTPRRKDAYDRALELVAIAQRLLATATARFHLKDRLDRTVTSLVFELGKARHLPSSLRWRNLRKAEDLATECATILDILRHQHAAAATDLDAAQDVLRELLAEL